MVSEKKSSWDWWDIMEVTLNAMMFVSELLFG